MLGMFASCASLKLSPRAESPLPIEVVQGDSGRLTSLSAREIDGRLYVFIRARENPMRMQTHVDIELIGLSGQVIAGRRGAVEAVHPAVGGGRRAFGVWVASFPSRDARRASKIRVTHHDKPHAPRS